MEIFKKEYDRLQNEVLVNVLECGLCQSFSCGKSHGKFFLVVIDVEKPGVNLVKFLILQNKIGKFKSRM